MAPDVDLSVLAREAEGFSGADLQAMVYNAHLDVVHSSIALTTQTKSQSQDNGRPKQEEQAVKYRQIAPVLSVEISAAARGEMDKKVSFPFQNMDESKLMIRWTPSWRIRLVLVCEK